MENMAAENRAGKGSRKKELDSITTDTDDSHSTVMICYSDWESSKLLKLQSDEIKGDNIPDHDYRIRETNDINTFHQCMVCDEIFDHYDDLEKHNKRHIKKEKIDVVEGNESMQEFSDLEHCTGTSSQRYDKPNESFLELSDSEHCTSSKIYDEGTESIAITSYHCNICNMSFQQYSDIEKHNKIHKEVELETGLCSSNFETSETDPCSSNYETGLCSSNYETVVTDPCGSNFENREIGPCSSNFETGLTGLCSSTLETSTTSKTGLCSSKFPQVAGFEIYNDQPVDDEMLDEKSMCELCHGNYISCPCDHSNHLYATAKMKVEDNIPVNENLGCDDQDTVARTLICTVCGKTFRHKINLQQHMYYHIDGTPHKCNVCNKFFIMSSHLLAHMRTHSVNGKPFRCEVCCKAFRRVTSLQKHRSRKNVCNENKPIKCNICRKGFDNPSPFNAHMRTHTGEKPYTCVICKRSFKERSKLTRHLKAFGPVHTNPLVTSNQNIEGAAVS